MAHRNLLFRHRRRRRHHQLQKESYGIENLVKRRTVLHNNNNKQPRWETSPNHRSQALRGTIRFFPSLAWLLAILSVTSTAYL